MSILDSIPQYGNYGGNGRNDAWNMASEYWGTTIEHNKYNIPLVYEAMNKTGRFPVDNYDWAYFYHEIGSITTDGLGQVLNDIGMGVNILSSLLGFSPSYNGWAGIGYAIASIPFIGGIASVYQEGVAVVEGLGDLAGSVSDAVGDVWNGISDAFGDMGNFDFGGALSDFGGGISDAITAIGRGFGDLFEQIFPVVIDLDGNGISLISLNDSQAHVLINDSHNSSHTGWISGHTAILAFDVNHNGIVDNSREYDFTQYMVGAKTDLQGLSAFDSNHDRRLDVNDALFSSFVVWVDSNGDGISTPNEVMTLSQAGITSIDLTLNGAHSVVAGNLVSNTTTVRMADGSIHTADDVAFNSEQTNSAVTVLGLGITEATDASGVATVLISADNIAIALDTTALASNANLLGVVVKGTGDTVHVTAGVAAEILSGPGNNCIFGDDVGDLFHIGLGNAQIVGGTGNDIYEFAGAWGQTEIADMGGTNFVDFTDAKTTNLIFTQAGDSLLISDTAIRSQVKIDGWFTSVSHSTFILAGQNEIDFNGVAKIIGFTDANIIDAAWLHA